MSWLLLALGGALAIGNLLALINPKEQRKNTAPQSITSESESESESTKDLPSAPLFRSIFMIALGTGVAIWALASLLSS